MPFLRDEVGRFSPSSHTPTPTTLPPHPHPHHPPCAQLCLDLSLLRDEVGRFAPSSSVHGRNPSAAGHPGAGAGAWAAGGRNPSAAGHGGGGAPVVEVSGLASVHSSWAPGGGGGAGGRGARPMRSAVHALAARMDEMEREWAAYWVRGAAGGSARIVGR